MFKELSLAAQDCWLLKRRFSTKRCGMTKNFYYKRTDEYKPIVQRVRRGCFPVPMVHTAVLIQLTAKSSDLLTYDPTNVKDYKGPSDDIITFAVNAKKNGKISMFLPIMS